MITNLPTAIAELKKRIQTAIAPISEDSLQNVVKHTEFRLRLLLRENDAHLKKLLNRVELVPFIFNALKSS